MIEVSSGFIYHGVMNIKPYKQIDGKWYRAKCNNCGVLIQRIHQKLCKDCWIDSIKGDSQRVPSRLGAKLSEKSKQKISKTKLNGKKISYQGLHQRLYREKGYAKNCENKDCKGLSKNYDWANYTGKYDDVDDFIQLCRSCHHSFDRGGVKPRIL